MYQTQTITRGDTFKQVQTITYQPGADNSIVCQQANQREENPNVIYGPYRVFPGRLSVSRTFGDIEAKREKYGGNPNVVIATPEIKEFEINEKMDFIILGCKCSFPFSLTFFRRWHFRQNLEFGCDETLVDCCEEELQDEGSKHPRHLRPNDRPSDEGLHSLQNAR